MAERLLLANNLDALVAQLSERWGLAAHQHADVRHQLAGILMRQNDDLCFMLSKNIAGLRRLPMSNTSDEVQRVQRAIIDKIEDDVLNAVWPGDPEDLFSCRR